MANIQEIEHMLKLIDVKKTNISILHCVSKYPAPESDLNLSAIKTMREQFKLKIGWSDHSNLKNVVLTAFLKWGAEIIEMHLDIDKNGYDVSE